MPAVSRSDLLDALSPASSLPCHQARDKVVVLDDDPTGTQTVHGVPVLTTWEPSVLERELLEPGPGFYVLTNTRAFSVEEAVRLNVEIGRNLRAASAATGRTVSVVSRSDSTLRGHYPAETDALADALGGGFDGTVLIPAFFAGGRITVGDVHYVAEGDAFVPAGETEFARDATFGFRSSNLRDYVAEKTGGRVAAADVVSVSLEDLRRGGPGVAADRLLRMPRGGVAIVNAAAFPDLAVLTHALARAGEAGRRFLFRTAAEFVAAYMNIAPRPLLTPAEMRDRGSGAGGVLVAGSYVGRSSAQLDRLFADHPSIRRTEADVSRLLAAGTKDAEIARCRRELEEAVASGLPAVLFTSRRLVVGADADASLRIGTVVSSALVEIVREMSARPAWFVAKGGITSSDLATKALGLRRSMVLGQALPGVPVWSCGPESKWPGLPYVVFPGNVGGPDALARLVSALTSTG